MENLLAALDMGLVYKTLSVSALGALVYLSHGVVLNSYLRHQNTLLTAIMLPPVALIITTAIATNFFLSLGMIGALSIIRYRTPVKSQYELGLLFALITIGVVGGVNMPSAVWVSIFLIVLAPIYRLILLVVPSSWFNANTNDARKGSHRLIAAISGNLDDNMKVLDLGGKLVSVDVMKNETGSETNVHLTFDTLEQCIAAQSRIQNDSNVISISIS